ncbi:MFS family permease [Bradyrhizobium sp. JR6.1]
MAENDERERGPVSRGDVARYPVFAVVAVLLGAFLANFDSRLTSVGLPDLRGAFSLTFDEGAWLSTAAIGSQIFIAPAVAWLATAFGLRRVLGIPSLVYAVVSLIIPFVHDYTTLIVLSIAHGMLLGTFVPATLMIILRNLPIRWWLPAIAMYSIRVGFALDSSSSLVGFYVEHLGWQWLYWQGVVIAPLMGLMVYLGTPNEPVNRDLLHHADWGGMLLLGAGLGMVYAGLDQGNRLDWLSSGTVMALLIGGGLLIIAFMINETVARRPWAHFNVLFSRNIGLSLIVILLYTLTSLSNSSLVPNFLGTIGALRPEQSGVLLFTYGALPMFVLVPISIVLLRHLDPRIVVVLGILGIRSGQSLGHAAEPCLGTRGLRRHRPAHVGRAGVHAAADHHHGAVQFRSVAGDGIRGLYPDHAARRRRDRHRSDGHLAAGPRADPFELSRPARPERRCRRREPAEAVGG